MLLLFDCPVTGLRMHSRHLPPPPSPRHLQSHHLCAVLLPVSHFPAHSRSRPPALLLLRLLLSHHCLTFLLLFSRCPACGHLPPEKRGCCFACYVITVSPPGFFVACCFLLFLQPSSPASAAPVAPAAPAAAEQHWPTLGDSKEAPKKKKGSSTPPEQPPAAAGSSKVRGRGHAVWVLGCAV